MRFTSFFKTTTASLPLRSFHTLNLMPRLKLKESLYLLDKKNKEKISKELQSDIAKAMKWGSYDWSLVSPSESRLVYLQDLFLQIVKAPHLQVSNEEHFLLLQKLMISNEGMALFIFCDTYKEALKEALENNISNIFGKTTSSRWASQILLIALTDSLDVSCFSQSFWEVVVSIPQFYQEKIMDKVVDILMNESIEVSKILEDIPISEPENYLKIKLVLESKMDHKNSDPLSFKL